MPSEYLTTTDYPEYLSADAFGASQAGGNVAGDVRRASVLVDAYLNRPEGMVWVPDSLGRPAYMAALGPTQAVEIVAPMAPGLNVAVALPYATYDLIGEVFILDRGQPACEAVTVIGVDTVNGAITLARVLKFHASGALLEAGLSIMEDRALPSRRPIARVSRPNLAGLLSAAGRYGYGRRSDQQSGYASEMNLLASLQTLGAEQTWQPIDAGNVSISSVTGECWITSGLAMAYFSEVRLRYIAGFTAATLPRAIKQATANIMANFAQDDDMSPVFKVMQAGGTKMERFSDAHIDSDTKALLSSYQTRVMV